MSVEMYMYYDFEDCPFMEEAGVVEVLDTDWESMVEKNSRPVLVMFYSPTCRHCIQIQPFFEELAKSFSETVSFVRLNVIRFSWLAERYGIMATPTFQYFCGGKPVQSRVGAVYPAMLKKMIEEMNEHGEECRLRSSEIRYEVTGYG